MESNPSWLNTFIKKCLLTLDRDTKLTLFVYGFFIGIVFAICYSVSLSQNITLKFFMEKMVNNNESIYAAILGVIGTMISITVTISTQTTSDHIKKYYSPIVVKMFREEFAYRIQFINAGLCFIICIFLLVWKNPDNSDSSILRSTLTLCSAFLFLWSAFWLYRFLRLIFQYTLGVENKVIEKFKKTIDEIIEE